MEVKLKKAEYISGEGEIITYAWMWKNAKISLEAAEKSEEGQFFNVMNTVVFSAFAMEAFFNHLGLKRIEDWQKKERKLSKLKKLMFWLSELKIEADISQRPYFSVTEAFRFRDLLAHGKTEVVNQNEKVEFEEDEQNNYMIENEWMKLCNFETAKRIFIDVETLIYKLYKAAGYGDYPFMHFHSSIFNVKMAT